MLRGVCTAMTENRFDLSLDLFASSSGLSAQLTLFAGAENLLNFLDSLLGLLVSMLTRMLLTDPSLTLDAEDAVSLRLDWPELLSLDDEDEAESLGGTAGGKEGDDDMEGIRTILVKIDDILPLDTADSGSLFKGGEN